MGLDSLLSIAQMPGGIPVGTLAIGEAGAKNAALLAASDYRLTSTKRFAKSLQAFRKKQTEAVLAQRVAMTQVLPSRTPEERAKAAARAAELLRGGDPVALPTETVYGLAADALKSESPSRRFSRRRNGRVLIHSSFICPVATGSNASRSRSDDSRELIEKLIDAILAGTVHDCSAEAGNRSRHCHGRSRHGRCSNQCASALCGHHSCIRIRPWPRRARIVLAGSARRPRSMWWTNSMGESHSSSMPGQPGMESNRPSSRSRNGRIELLRRGPVTTEQLRAFGEVVRRPNPLRALKRRVNCRRITRR